MPSGVGRSTIPSFGDEAATGSSPRLGLGLSRGRIGDDTSKAWQFVWQKRYYPQPILRISIYNIHM